MGNSFSTGGQTTADVAGKYSSGRRSGESYKGIETEGASAWESQMISMPLLRSISRELRDPLKSRRRRRSHRRRITNPVDVIRTFCAIT